MVPGCSDDGADFQINGDLWYKIFPPADGTATIDTCDGTNFDTKLAAYAGQPCDVNARYLGCSDNACYLRSSVTFPVLAGQAYFIRVGGYLESRGTGLLRYTFTPTPPPCPADFNGDGFLDFFDYDDFVTCFETGACAPGDSADFNGDQFVDFFDYDDFVTAFEAGC